SGWDGNRPGGGGLARLRSRPASAAAQAAAAWVGGIENVVEVGDMSQFAAIRLLLQFSAFGVGLFLPVANKNETEITADAESDHEGGDLRHLQQPGFPFGRRSPTPQRRAGCGLLSRRSFGLRLGSADGEFRRGRYRNLRHKRSGPGCGWRRSRASFGL